MFGVAQWVVRHKVLVVGVAAAGFIFFGGNKEEQKPANPWAVNVQPQQAEASSGSKGGFDKAYGAVAKAAKKYADVDIDGVNPSKLSDSTKANFANAEDGMKKANGN